MCSSDLLHTIAVLFVLYCTVCLLGTNQFASQKGMRIGAIRHVADIDTGASTQESQGLLNPQLGTGEYASQKGMSIGRFRHVHSLTALKHRIRAVRE